jgi:hypothetical protein
LHPNTGKKSADVSAAAKLFGLNYNAVATCTWDSVKAAIANNDPSLLIVKATGLPLIPPAVQTPPPPIVPAAPNTVLGLVKALVEAAIDEAATNGLPAGADPAVLDKALERFQKLYARAEHPTTPKPEAVNALRQAVKIACELIN